MVNIVVLRSLGNGNGSVPPETLGEEIGSGNTMRSVVNKFSLKCLWITQVETTSQLFKPSLEMWGAVSRERLCGEPW